MRGQLQPAGVRFGLIKVTPRIEELTGSEFSWIEKTKDPEVCSLMKMGKLPATS